ncbi:hypothetical protein CWI38_0199p0030 [Hamiltosporidium tvaerminnensis]|uniref:Uncharacterized protein n=1 Tax=Hamiltosporidium tvaerminnensis TaxID=1176355 RepID=A0A4Q9LZP2_9MICR|nr:hypothetical protein CWI38_0199p0030 [Hamiltosporidium tvaerminnensis]
MHIFIQFLIVYSTNEIFKTAICNDNIQEEVTVSLDNSNVQLKEKELKSKVDGSDTKMLDNILKNEITGQNDSSEKTKSTESNSKIHSNREPQRTRNHYQRKSTSHGYPSKIREKRFGKGVRRSNPIMKNGGKKLKSVVHLPNMVRHHGNSEKIYQPTNNFIQFSSYSRLDIIEPLVFINLIQKNELKDLIRTIERLIRNNKKIQKHCRRAETWEYIDYLANLIEASDGPLEKLNSNILTKIEVSEVCLQTYDQPKNNLMAIIKWLTTIFNTTKLLKDTSLVKEIFNKFRRGNTTKNELQRLNYLLIKIDNLLKSKELIHNPQIHFDKQQCVRKLKEIFEKEFQKKIYCVFPDLEMVLNSFFGNVEYSIKLSLKSIFPTLCLIILTNFLCEILTEDEFSGKTHFLASQASFPYILLIFLIIRDLFFSLDSLSTILDNEQKILEKYMETLIFLFSNRPVGIKPFQDNSIFLVSLFIYSNMFCFSELNKSHNSKSSRIFYLNLISSINQKVFNYRNDRNKNIQELYNDIYIIVRNNLNSFKNILQKRIYLLQFKSDDSAYQDILCWAYSSDVRVPEFKIIFENILTFYIYSRFIKENHTKQL